MDKTYADTVRLLLAVAPDVFANDIFAMKGGTASRVGGDGEHEGVAGDVVPLAGVDEAFGDGPIHCLAIRASEDIDGCPGTDLLQQGA